MARTKLQGGYYTDGTVDPATGGFKVFDKTGQPVHGAVVHAGGHVTVPGGAPAAGAAATPAASNGFQYPGTIDPKTGAFVVHDAQGNIIPGAIPFVRGNTTGVDKPATTLTDLPAGSYDPALGYYSQNQNLGTLQAHQDYGTQYDGAQLDANGNLIADPNASGRALQDYALGKSNLALALSRATQDYGTNTANLQRNYGNLGQSQLQAINQAGDLEGGALAQALGKRTANQARDQAVLDTGFQRYGQDNTLQGQALATQANRGFSDATLGLGRTDQANALYQGGLFNTASSEANQSGMLIGNPNYVTHNGTLYQTFPDGTRKPVRPAAQPQPVVTGMARQPTTPNPNRPRRANLVAVRGH